VGLLGAKAAAELRDREDACKGKKKRRCFP